MNKILAALTAAFLPGQRARATVKLGSENDPIRQMLFASQSLQEQAARVRPGSGPSPFDAVLDAARFAQAGQRTEAIDTLRTLLTSSDRETRRCLWAWSALRELGEVPSSDIAGEVLGVVLEVPAGTGYDTLAAYSDGTARYLNFSGAAIFWDKPDREIKELCARLLSVGAAAGETAQPRISLALPKHGGRATLLTRAGLFTIDDPDQDIIAHGAGLMMRLMTRAAEEKSR